MITANYAEFRNPIAALFDSVGYDNETLIIKRKSGKGVVALSLNEYKTLHVLSSKKNADRLYESIG